LRVRASAPRDIDVTIAANQMPGSNTNGATSAPMFFAGSWHEASIHHRGSLREGAVIKGPARISQSDSTTIVAPGWVAHVDRRGNIAITHEVLNND
jgi:N-methylhydantoinase A/oxoprolinase/acetone carboxylase beta subunit